VAAVALILIAARYSCGVASGLHRRTPRPRQAQKETAMPTRKLKRISLAQLLVGACAVIFGCVLIEHAQAQFAVPPPPPPVVNPSPPNTTVPQPSYKPISPATPSGVPGPEITSPANEEPPSTTARSGRGASVATARSVHHHYRGRFVGSHYCGYSPCVRIYPSAIYGVPASALWWPGFYDYAPGQFAHGRPRYSGYWRPAGYHGD